MREGHTQILVCTTYRLNIFLNPPEAAKVATFVKFFKVELNLGMFSSSRFWDTIFFHSV